MSAINFSTFHYTPFKSLNPIKSQIKNLYDLAFSQFMLSFKNIVIFRISLPHFCKNSLNPFDVIYKTILTKIDKN
jgi:hypothetical protein